MTHWETLTPAERSRWAAWIAETCELFGCTPGTAHQVASLFYGGLERERTTQ